MSIHCGDCGTKTYIEGDYRVCSTCGTRTRLRMVTKTTGRMSWAKPNQANPPRGSRYTGGGVQGACHSCGNSRGECEC